MRRWKQNVVSAFLHAAQMESRYFVSPAAAVKAAGRAEGCVVVWAAKSSERVKQLCADENVPLYHMEDGFLRSRGLGALRIAPISLALDGRGIYYDARGPSDLEIMLEHAELSAAEMEQAVVLRSKIVAAGLSKYNVGEPYQVPDLPDDRRIVLVPGQVAGDASLRFGGGAIGNNLDLLKAARQDNPDAFIIYKPHPDVEAGKRNGSLSSASVLRYADFIAAGMSSDAAIAVADEVVTMTSLIGFEALLRGKTVTCHGMPFYAGWGVTNDRAHCARRTRKRSVDEILAAAYLKYARYIDPKTHQAIGAMDAAAILLG
jgi:capsular polysaccharide export protein